MSEFKAEDFMESVKGMKSTEEVDVAFAKLSRADVDAIEGLLVTGYKEQIDNMGLEKVKKEIQSFPVMAQMYKDYREDLVSDLQMISQCMLNISTIKTESADPMIKAYVREAEKLSDTEYHTVDGLIKPLLAMMEAAVEPEAVPDVVVKPNPFRQKKFGM